MSLGGTPGGRDGAGGGGKGQVLTNPKGPKVSTNYKRVNQRTRQEFILCETHGVRLGAKQTMTIFGHIQKVCLD